MKGKDYNKFGNSVIVQRHGEHAKAQGIQEDGIWSSQKQACNPLM